MSEDSLEAMIGAVGERIVEAIEAIPRPSGCPVCGVAWRRIESTGDGQTTAATCKNGHKLKVVSEA